MRLIDADALKAESFGVYDSNGELRFVVDVNEIEKQPTVNADPVVRCWECRWFDKTELSGTVEPIGFRCKRRHIFVYADDFCKRGERREE